MFSDFVSLPCLFQPRIPEAGGSLLLGGWGGGIPAVCGQGSALGAALDAVVAAAVCVGVVVGLRSLQ